MTNGSCETDVKLPTIGRGDAFEDSHCGGEQENKEVMEGALWVSFSIFPLRMKVSQHLYALWSKTKTFLCF